MPANTEGRWHEDGVDGRPSSMELLLRWLHTDGNAARWRNSAQKRLKATLVRELHDFLVRHGIVHRTIDGISCKLRQLGKQVDEVNEWLRTKRVRHLDVNKNVQQKVLQLCPEYFEIAPLLRSTRFRVTQAPDTLSTRTILCAASRTTNSIADTMGNPSWDEDGVGGGPSSIEVLLEWLSMSGNAARWRRLAEKGNGARVELFNEIYDLLLSYSINHRTIGSIKSRLWVLEHQLKEAEDWLKSRGLRNYDFSRKTEDAVLRLCPYYPEIKSLLRPKRPAPAPPVAPVARSRIYSSDESDESGVSSREEFEFCGSSSDDDEELPNLGSKRCGIGGPYALQDEGTKRPRVDYQLQKVKLEDTKCVALLEAEPDERREFFKLELQVKRDQAILVRVKTRKELFDMGVSVADVDRLLPLKL